MRPFVIRDNVYGDIQVDPLTHKILKHPLVQRLKGIKQNGFLYLVYPGVTHNRFEHSLGAYHLAGRLFDSVIERFERQKKWEWHSSVKDFEDKAIEIRPTISALELIHNDQQNKRKWKRRFQLAALFHDLGHGPFSHTFEKLGLIDPAKFKYNFLTSSTADQWYSKKTEIEHEDLSVVFIDEIVNDYKSGEDRLDPNDFHAIACMVSKDFRKFFFGQEADESTKNMISLWSTFVSGFIDVDRMDYIVRDSQMAGIPYGNVGIDRLVASVDPVLVRDFSNDQMIGGVLTKAQYRHTIDHFVFCLYEMYTQLYLHPAAIRIEQEFKMIVEESKQIRKVVDLDWYRNKASDERFVFEIEESLQGLISDVFSRRLRDEKKVAFQLTDPGEEIRKIMVEQKYHIIEDIKGREIAKEKVNVYLLESAGPFVGRIIPWNNVSVLAPIIDSKSKYMPSIYWKNETFINTLDEVKRKIKEAA